MGRMSELDAQIKELRSCGEAIIGIADSLREMFTSAEPEPETPAVTEPVEEVKQLSFEEVRHRMTLVSQAGFSAEVKALIGKYGARRLSDIDPSRYGDLLREAESLGKQEDSDG